MAKMIYRFNPRLVTNSLETNGSLDTAMKLFNINALANKIIIMPVALKVLVDDLQIAFCTKLSPEQVRESRLGTFRGFRLE